MSKLTMVEGPCKAEQKNVPTQLKLAINGTLINIDLEGDGVRLHPQSVKAMVHFNAGPGTEVNLL